MVRYGGLLLVCIICHYIIVNGNRLINEEQLITDLYCDIRENVLSFSNKWIVKLRNNKTMNDIVNNNHFRYHGQINDFENYHLFEKSDYIHDSHEENHQHTRELNENENIVWAQQLFHRQLHKRDFSFSGWDMNASIDVVQDLHDKKLKAIQRSLFDRNLIDDISDINTIDFKSLYKEEFNDELWILQWYELGFKLNSTIPVTDINVVPVYQKYNITGRGVRILIIDDGIEYTHEDIRSNFDETISYNLNMNTPDVMPRYTDPRNRHGTKCAGVIVMKANNQKCGVGIAYDAKVGGITLLDGVIDDLMEAKAIKYANDRVDIYSGSWGPPDNGKALDGPGHLSSVAFYHGITMGRNGHGSLYVFAAGNGGVFGDHCGADGYVNSIYSIAIASTTYSGDLPFYAERCPAIIATTFSGHASDEVKIVGYDLHGDRDAKNYRQVKVTTDINNSCTLDHSGTSASAPFVAGILALVLEANRNLTWRDVQHLIIWSCEISPLKQDIDWFKNSSGLWFTPQFGFGLINAFKMVTLAMDWVTVPEKFICSVPFDLRNVNQIFSSKTPFVGFAYTNGCNDTIKYLEHVQLSITAEYTVRGSLEILLISPSGTVSKLLEPRQNDFNSNFVRWPFMSLQFWGEPAVGLWTVFITDKVSEGSYHGHVDFIQLILHGTRDTPDHYITKSREYNSF